MTAPVSDLTRAFVRVNRLTLQGGPGGLFTVVADYAPVLKAANFGLDGKQMTCLEEVQLILCPGCRFGIQVASAYNLSVCVREVGFILRQGDCGE